MEDRVPNPGYCLDTFHVITGDNLSIVPSSFLQIKRIIHLEVQSKPMYLRTLLYALRQGVALGTHEPPSTCSLQGCASRMGHGQAIGASSGTLVKYDGSAESVRVPDELLDLYLSSQDSTSLTSKVLDVYAAYVDEGEVSIAAVRFVSSQL